MESSEFVEEYIPEFDTIDCCELKVTQNLLTQAPFEGLLKYPSYDLLNDYKSHCFKCAQRRDGEASAFTPASIAAYA